MFGLRSTTKMRALRSVVLFLCFGICFFATAVSCLPGGAKPPGGPDIVRDAETLEIPTPAGPHTTSQPQQRRRRPLTVLEMQPYLMGYSCALSFFAPLAMVYQLSALHPEVRVSPKKMFLVSVAIVPHQTILKMIQMNAATTVTKSMNHMAAFAMVGILQGAVYGQANIFFAKTLKIAGRGTKLSIAGIFRGTGFAACRDVVSQGLPFVLAPKLRTGVFDKIWKSKDAGAKSLKKWVSVFTVSIISTFASQIFHSSQTTMQADHSLSYKGALEDLWNRNGKSMFYKGAEARVALNIVVNLLNQLLLKKAWMGVEVKENVKTTKEAREAREQEEREARMQESTCSSQEECLAKCGDRKSVV